MKDLLNIVFISVILAVALVLTCEQEEIKEEKPMITPVDNYINYTLIPQRYGLDTLCIKAQSVEELVVTKWFLDQTSQVETNYIVFIENNKIKTAVNKQDYQLKID